MNSVHKPKLGQSDLVYWVYRLENAYTVVLPVELHSPQDA